MAQAVKIGGFIYEVYTDYGLYIREYSGGVKKK